MGVVMGFIGGKKEKQLAHLAHKFDYVRPQM
jgi:hypothetical protein